MEINKENTKIMDFFLQDYNHIYLLIDQVLRSDSNDPIQIHQDLKDIHFEIDRHTYLEEKAMLLYCEFGESINKYVAMKLFSDHDILMKRIEFIEEISTKESIPSLYDFNLFLQRHVDFEMKYFYPIFDRNLFEADQRHFILKLKEEKASDVFPLDKIRETGKSCLKFF